MMKAWSLSLVACWLACVTLEAAEPLRVFIRGGKKSHGPEGNDIHEHARFLGDWTKLLTERGMKVSGAMEFPTAAQLEQVDVLILYAQEGGEIPVESRPGLERFLKRGGGIVVLHTASVPLNKPGSSAYLKSVIGGSWVWGQTKWLEGPMSLYYVDRTHPITQGVGNFDLDDEIYYDMDLDSGVRVLAAAYTPNLRGRGGDRRGQPQSGKVTVYDIQPQMWLYEKTLEGGQPYRAFVSIPGHRLSTFNLPHYRAVLLRGIAWAAGRSNLDEFSIREEFASLRYPAGGASRPEQCLTRLEIHPEFTVSLVAAEPLINKPMNIDWDPQGRLWVAETPEYPDGRYANAPADLVQRWVEGEPDAATGRYRRLAFDKISMLTDRDGDGIMDRRHIFYEGLELVTSFVFYKDGVIAAAAPDIWFLRDTDGDNIADKVEKLYGGLGTQDTHAVINNLRWGFDGWIYATHGYSATRNLLSGDGKTDFGPVNSGVVRFKPDGSAFEQFSSKGGNTWGLQIAWDNEVFWTQPTSGDLLMHVVLSEGQIARSGTRGLTSFRVVSKSLPSFPLIAYEQLPYVQIDQVGRFTAAAGTVIYDGGAWPPKWNYGYFTTEPTINVVHHQSVRPDGVSYTASRESGRETLEFIGGRDMWFRPIEVRVGPDGAVYVVDFYNQAVVHNDTRGPKHGPRNAAIRPDRDHYYGRIWRINHKQAGKLEVPNLSRASAAELAQALEHTNQHVRMNALRLLGERSPETAMTTALRQLAASQKSPQARVAALWALAQQGQLDADTVAVTAGDDAPAVRKNGMMAAAAVKIDAQTAALMLAKDPDPRVQLQALNTLATGPVDDPIARRLMALYPGLRDAHLKAAFMNIANKAPEAFLNAAFAAQDSDGIAPLVAALTLSVVGSKPDDAARLVITLAAKPPAQDGLKQSLLASLAAGSGATPAWSADLEQALRSLLASTNSRLSAAALPLASRWDQNHSLTDELKRVVAELSRTTRDASLSDDFRAASASALLNVRQGYPEVLPAIVATLTTDAKPALQRRLVEALGALPDENVGPALVNALLLLRGEAQSTALDQLLKRAPWTLALLDAVDTGRVPHGVLNPAYVYRLRLHPNAEVAKRANSSLDKLRGPEAKEKAALIAKLAPEVEKPGAASKGKTVFLENCAGCHPFGGSGGLAGPPLDGMGAHGPAELLGHILDPNREVDPAFAAVTIETRDGESYDGVVGRENAVMIALRNASGETEIAKDKIASRRNTGRSLMPEGFEALGAESLRNLLAFICADASRFRFIELAGAFTADSRKGMYRSLESEGERLHLTRRGVALAHGVPFRIADPAKHPRGWDVLVLKGGSGADVFSRTLPQTAEAKLGFAAKQLHVLGGIAGWGFPAVPDKIPALKLTVHYADGQTEEFIAYNTIEFADYNRVIDVPGSKLVTGYTQGDQLRFYSHRIGRDAVIDRVTFESFNNNVAPTLVAMTADLSVAPLIPGAAGTATDARPSTATQAQRPNADPPASGGNDANKAGAAQESFKWGAGIKALVVGGGSAHDFHRFFNLADLDTLKTAGFSAHYTESPEVTVRELKRADTAILSVNRNEWATPAVRKALLDFADAGKGLVLLHAGVWYNFADWPEYNRILAGGGSRGHDRLGEFTVTALKPAHPILKDVPASFKITDELYYMMPDPEGAPIEILAETSPSQRYNKPHPSVWIVRHPKARIVGLALGHDGRAHSLPAFQKLLINAATWTAGKP